MAVMYSKLGGCLWVTAKLDPLARTDLWAGVKGLLERFMTHLGLSSSLEEPWGGLLGGGGGRVVFPGDGAILLGRLGCPVPRGTPMALPKWPSWIVKLTCMWRASGLGNAASFAGGKESSGLGRIASFPRRKVSNCLGRTASFTQGKVSSCQGRIASFAGGKVSSCQERFASFPRRKVSNCQSRVSGNAWCLTAYWGRLTVYWGRIYGLGRTAYFLRGKESACLTVSFGCVVTFPMGEVLACLTDWEPKLLDQMRFIALALVIFPSFLLIRILNLFNCLCLTLVNLISIYLHQV